MKKTIYLKDLYSFPGFHALGRLRANPKHHGAMIVTLQRRQKKRFVPAVRFTAVGMTTGEGLSVTLAVEIPLFIWSLIFAASNVQSAKL